MNLGLKEVFFGLISVVCTGGLMYFVDNQRIEEMIILVATPLVIVMMITLECCYQLLKIIRRKIK